MKISFFPFLQVVWVGEALHNAGMTAVLAANRRRLSLVDCVSFAAARQFGVKTLFAFDAHFVKQVSFSGKDKRSEKHCYN